MAARRFEPCGTLRRAGLCLVLVAASLLAPGPGARAAPDPAALCDAAILRAAADSGVPVAVLRAIALAETGRRIAGTMRPWPWTLNFGGDGRWFATRAEAEAALAEGIAAGRRNIDVGCFQINLRWHGSAFPAPQAMFAPDANAGYAARFLADLHAETGDWPAAAGAFHSRTAVHADRYRARFETILAGLGRAAGPAPDARAGRRFNPYPLLLPGGTPAGGSLFPPGAPPALRLIAAPRAPLWTEG